MLAEGALADPRKIAFTESATPPQPSEAEFGRAVKVLERDEALGPLLTAPAFGRGDLWVLRYHGNEIDDGVVAVGPPYEAGLDQWVNGEAISNHDVVVWYGAHFTHDVQGHGAAGHGHIVGPDLKAVSW